MNQQRETHSQRKDYKGTAWHRIKWWPPFCLKRISIIHTNLKTGGSTFVGHFKWHLLNKEGGWDYLSFVEYSLSKSVHLTPDIVEYDTGATAPLYDLIIGKQTLHDIGAVLDFKEKTITIDSILWPTRNIVNLQVKPSVTQEPISTPKATKRFIGILDAKYDKAEFRDCKDILSSPNAITTRYAALIATRLRVALWRHIGDWNRPPASI